MLTGLSHKHRENEETADDVCAHKPGQILLDFSQTTKEGDTLFVN